MGAKSTLLHETSTLPRPFTRGLGSTTKGMRRLKSCMLFFITRQRGPKPTSTSSPSGRPWSLVTKKSRFPPVRSMKYS